MQTSNNQICQKIKPSAAFTLQKFSRFDQKTIFYWILKKLMCQKH